MKTIKYFYAAQLRLWSFNFVMFS